MASKNEKLEKRGIHLLFGEIEEETARAAVEFILEAQGQQTEALTLVVNSVGGSVYEGFAIIDAMAGSKIPVRTLGLGCVASMGLDIFVAGQKGTRTLTPNTTVMCHQWAGGSWGKAHELLAASRAHELLTEKVIRHFVRHTGMRERKVREILLPPHDVWLSAAEAKKLGLCDLVKDC